MTLLRFPQSTTPGRLSPARPAQPKICGKQTIVVTNPDGNICHQQHCFCAIRQRCRLQPERPLQLAQTRSELPQPMSMGTATWILIHSQFGAANFAVRQATAMEPSKQNHHCHRRYESCRLAVADVNGDKSSTSLLPTRVEQRRVPLAEMVASHLLLLLAYCDGDEPANGRQCARCQQGRKARHSGVKLHKRSGQRIPG